MKEPFPTPDTSSCFNMPPITPDTLCLDEKKLHQAASTIGERGITLAALRTIAADKIERTNPLLSHIIEGVSGRIKQTGGDYRSFGRGATLGLHLIDEARANGVPSLAIDIFEIAARYTEAPPTLAALRTAAEGLLVSQLAINSAINTALPGMPEGTDPILARFGAGISTMSVIATVQQVESFGSQS